MNKYSEEIDLNLLNGSIETISGVQNLINNVDLTDNFIELEEYFRKINFEHSYCINYKKTMELIYNNLDDIKNKINRLSEVLSVIKNSYSDILEEETNSNGISNFFKNAKTSVNESITKIEPQNNQQSIEEKPYSTVPIGLAIGATGIAGSVGAVVVNEKYGSELQDYEPDELSEILPDYESDELSEKLPDYEQNKLLEENSDSEANELSEEESDYESNEYPKQIEEETLPYHASRTIRESDKYYGNSDNELELEDYDDSSIDEFDE